MNKKNISRISLVVGGTLVALFFVLSAAIPQARAMITNQLDIGSTGSDVTELQTYFATDASIYPSGLVTGYFGPLTQAATQRFQAAQGIVSSGTPGTTGYGHVGPQTIARVNSLSGSAGGTQVSWDTVPALSNPTVQYTRTSATLSWTTNEPTQGQVYYDVTPLQANEATGPRQQPYISGTFATDGTGLNTVHNVTLQNLQPNTRYYFTTRGVDSVGNMSMTWPSSFQTSQ